MFAVFQARDSHTSFSPIFFRTASLYLHQPFVVSSVCESATASPRSCLTESMESNRSLVFGSFIVQVMQSVEIEKQQSRRLVSGDSLYHSIAGVLGFELFTTQEVANKGKKQLISCLT